MPHIQVVAGDRPLQPFDEPSYERLDLTSTAAGGTGIVNTCSTTGLTRESNLIAINVVGDNLTRPLAGRAGMSIVTGTFAGRACRPCGACHHSLSSFRLYLEGRFLTSMP